MLPAAAQRTLRRLLLAHARRLPVAQALVRSRNAALHVARWAAGVSPAYAQLLREHGLTPARLGTGLPLQALPVLSKANTFGRFTLAEQAAGGGREGIADGAAAPCAATVQLGQDFGG